MEMHHEKHAKMPYLPRLGRLKVWRVDDKRLVGLVVGGRRPEGLGVRPMTHLGQTEATGALAVLEELL